MKTKILLTLLLSLNFCLLSSQVPQGFNYQAIARDNKGNPIPGAIMLVRIGILSDTIANNMVWEELFNPVTTNAFGMFTIVVGTGVKQSGSASSFSAIDWTKTPLFLRTSIYYPSSWKVMGTTKLQSVPYSMVAANLEGTVPLLSVKGNTTTMDSALFVVRNNTGQIVFAVYNEGVRIYVDDGVAKGSKKGGFAIGSFDRSKGTSQPYFIVDADSIRAYINDVGKATKGGFAIGSFDKSKGGNINYLNVATDANGIINPSQNRILWYPIKNAFLTGRVRIGTPDSVGENSFASGYETKARGVYSQALGYKAIANGDYSTAIGKNAVANNINSFAFGDSAQAIKSESYAIGRGAVASGYRSFALGSAGVDSTGNLTDVARAIGDYSFAIGQGSQTFGHGAFALGLADTAKGDFSLAMGYLTSSKGKFSTAIGLYNKAIGEFSIAMGKQTEASAESSTAMGNNSIASGACSMASGNNALASGFSSTALGFFTTASGDYSTAFGLRNYASGERSTAIGMMTTASGWCSTTIGMFTEGSGSNSTSIGAWSKAKGDYSTAIGYKTIASGWNSTAIGYYTIAKPIISTAIGQYNDTTCSAGGDLNYVTTDPLFIIGNGSSSTRSNALTVLRNGNTAIGHASPTQMLDVNGNARFRSVGSGAFAYNLNIMSDGTLTTATSDIRMKENIYQITNALGKINELRGVTFTWKNDSTKTRQIGMIAQEVEPIVPEIVFTNPVDGLKGINYSQASALFVEAIKEQQKQIEDQQRRIDSYKSENNNLKSQLQSLQEKFEQIESQQKEIDELKTLVNTLVANQTGQK